MRERGVGLLRHKGWGMNILIKLGNGLPRPPESRRTSRRAYLTSVLRTSGLQINDVRSRLDTTDTINFDPAQRGQGSPWAAPNSSSSSSSHSAPRSHQPGQQKGAIPGRAPPWGRTLLPRTAFPRYFGHTTITRHTNLCFRI